MKREFLEGLGLEKEVIDKIMDENGKDVTTLKTKVATLEDDLKVQKGLVETRNTEISELKKVDVEAIKKTEYEKGKTEGSAEVQKFKFNTALEKKLGDLKVKDAKAISGFLDMEKIKYENNEVTGLEDQITPLLESHPYLFDTEKELPHFTETTPGGSKKTITGDPEKMSYEDYKKWRKDNPNV
jgi:hypothetical protein